MPDTLKVMKMDEIRRYIACKVRKANPDMTPLEVINKVDDLVQKAISIGAIYRKDEAAPNQVPTPNQKSSNRTN